MENSSKIMSFLKRLFISQPLAVLATQSEGQPYSNLVAFAETDDLKHLIFITNRNTKKYANVMLNQQVAILIDSRTNKKSDFETAVAVTAIGKADEAMGKERDLLAEAYIAKHPHLAEFVNKPVNALMKIRITDCIIAGFENVQTIHISD